MTSSASQARQLRPDEPPDLILDDEDSKPAETQAHGTAKFDARRDTGTVEAEPEDLLVHEVPISLPGVLQPGLLKARSHQHGAVAASRDLASIRGSVSIRKGDLNNISTDILNPKLSVNGKTINKVTMRLPIFKIMQAQVIERYQHHGGGKKDE